jgi:hypothetical protein
LRVLPGNFAGSEVNVVHIVYVLHVCNGSPIQRLEVTIMCRRASRSVIRGIHEVGYLNEISDLANIGMPRITVSNNLNNSFVFESGITCIVLELRISADRPVYIQEFGAFKIAGQDYNVDWFIEEQSSCYIFSRTHDYPSDVVLNHRVGSRGHIVPGRRMEGLLLGRSEQSVPVELRNSYLDASLEIDNGFQTSRHDLGIRFDQGFSGQPGRRKERAPHPAKCEEKIAEVNGPPASSTPLPERPRRSSLFD